MSSRWKIYNQLCKQQKMYINFIRHYLTKQKDEKKSIYKDHSLVESN